MNTFLLASSRVSFAMSLVFSWTLVTVILALAAWRGEHAASTLARWAALWFFSVAAPTIQAVIVHRRLKDLMHAYADLPDRVIRDLTHARWTFLMFGALTVMTALALGLGR